MTVFGMGIGDFALIVLLVVAVAARLAWRFMRSSKIRKRNGDDREWWNY